MASVRGLHESSCTPQLFVGTGFPAWGDPANHQWTVGGILAYNTEAKMWGEFIEKKKPGRQGGPAGLQQRLRQGLPDGLRGRGRGEGLRDRRDQAARGHRGQHRQRGRGHPGRRPRRRDRRDDRRVLPHASWPDWPPVATRASRSSRRRAPRWRRSSSRSTRPATACTSSASRRTRAIPASPTTRPWWSTRPTSASTAPAPTPTTAPCSPGYNVGALLIDTLTRAAALDGGLTRANIMNAAWSIDFKLPLLVRWHGEAGRHQGRLHLRVRRDAAVRRRRRVRRSPTGDTFDVEGKTGVYQAG